jgi:protoporphyrinogen/coproporphyrinogen III oxidase
VNLPLGFGFLVPRRAGRRLLACTFVQGKFPFRAPEGAALLRCFLGGARDHDVLEMNDEQLGSLVVRELRDTLGLRETPGFIRIYRFPSAMPQYVVGHEERVRRIWEALDRHPGLFLAGNSYSGIGISDSIRTAKSAVEKAVSFSGTQQARGPERGDFGILEIQDPNPDRPPHIVRPPYRMVQKGIGVCRKG